MLTDWIDRFSFSFSDTNMTLRSKSCPFCLSNGFDGTRQLWILAQGHRRPSWSSWMLSVENVEAAAAKGHKHLDLSPRFIQNRLRGETAGNHKPCHPDSTWTPTQLTLSGLIWWFKVFQRLTPCGLNPLFFARTHGASQGLSSCATGFVSGGPTSRAETRWVCDVCPGLSWESWLNILYNIAYIVYIYIYVNVMYPLFFLQCIFYILQYRNFLVY